MSESSPEHRYQYYREFDQQRNVSRVMKSDLQTETAHEFYHDPKTGDIRRRFVTFSQLLHEHHIHRGELRQTTLDAITLDDTLVSNLIQGTLLGKIDYLTHLEGNFYRYYYHHQRKLIRSELIVLTENLKDIPQTTEQYDLFQHKTA